MARILLFVLLFAPSLANAATGLVPCGNDGQPSCQSCHLVTLADNVITWLVVVMGTIATIVFVYAGVRLVTSMGNGQAMKAAKTLLFNAIIGYVIILAGWFVIDTVMKAFLPGSSGELVGFGVWNNIQCVAQPAVADPDFTFDVYDSVVVTPGGGVYVPGGGGNPPGVPTGNGTCEEISDGPCSPGVLAGAGFGANAGAASQVCNGESAGNIQSESRTDRISTGQAFSFGLYQINITVHELQGCGPGGTTLNCPAAFSGTNYSAVIVNQDLYNQCANAAKTAECNTQNAVRIFNGRAARQPDNPWADWSAAVVCGLAT